MSAPPIKPIEQKIAPADLPRLFAEKSWHGITTADRIAVSSIAVVANTDITHIKLQEICLDMNGHPFLRIKNGEKDGKFFPVCATISDGLSRNKTGLPSTVVKTLIQDLRDYYALTGHSAVTRIIVGRTLSDVWQSSSHPHRLSAGMIRDISGHGVSYALPAPAEGALPASYKLAAGERLFYTGELLLREPPSNDDSIIPPIRSYTAAYVL